MDKNAEADKRLADLMERAVNLLRDESGRGTMSWLVTTQGVLQNVAKALRDAGVVPGGEA